MADSAQIGLFTDDELDDVAPVMNDTPELVYPKEAIAAAAFDHYRRTGFPYRALPVHQCMQEINALAALPIDALPQSIIAYQVADTYHPQRFHAHAAGMKSPVAAFHDDALLRRALDMTQRYGGQIGSGYIGKLSIVSGTQAASNFRPGFAAYIYRKYAPHRGATVLDTSTGYGGRLVGAMAALGMVGRYIGIDPATDTYLGNLRLAADLGWMDRVELIRLPVEDVNPIHLEGSCDLAFTSPPYFTKEHYCTEDTQSYLRYPTTEEWLHGFMIPMMRLQYRALRPDALAIVNVAPVRINGVRYPVDEWCTAAARYTGFTYLRTERFSMSNRIGVADDTVATEPVLIFQKY